MLTLNALYKHCIFESRERSETHELVARELSDHLLRWHDGAIDTRLYKFDTQRLSLYSLQYGGGVSIFPETYDRFSLVHFSYRGGIEVTADGVRQEVRPGNAIISSPSRSINLRWNKGCEQLILRLPHEVLHDAAGQLGQPHLGGALKGNPGLAISGAASLLWQHQLELFMGLEVYSRQNAAYGPWLEHVERGMVMFLLLQSPGAVPPPVESEDGERQPMIVSPARRRLDRLHEYAARHLDRPMGLSDLARAAFLSERQLNTFCHEQLGVSPLTWLRNLRLDAVRHRLRAEPDSDVAATAMLHGFSHLGRFARYYQQRFGELPSQTLKSARNG